MSTLDDAKTKAAEARAELASTLDQIEGKLNIPKRAGELSKKAQIAYEDNPVPFIAAGAAIAAGVIGLVAWAIFSDD
ncbi:DUF3618 domain-containing protein [Homoserinibacter sp. YIM 151385]|uniref:DUF3618 domain-containing protein n=1 Tax=Homoserinibacter sp. YIM 151385 TaxID=2985506 RepID=UPI0022F0FADC|nr:DUF3618 domain-containing protein [Homoserinibacter sp. YIM 151385]WBU37180.1 DUF3618 domain-containing protein [Homoserinibacter sp. YIM 151385]